MFHGQTLIEMADGSQKQIKDIQIGDEILTFNGEANILLPIKVDEITSKTINEWMDLEIAVNGIADKFTIDLMCSPDACIFSLDLSDIKLAKKLVCTHVKEHVGVYTRNIKIKEEYIKYVEFVDFFAQPVMRTNTYNSTNIGYMIHTKNHNFIANNVWVSSEKM